MTPHPLLGILLLLASTWSLSALDTAGKWVMGLGVSLLFMCWVRYIVHLVLVLSLVIPSKGLKTLRSVHLPNQILRGLLMLMATMSFFMTLSRLPQAEATSINFLAPLIMLATAPWLLKEPMRLSRWLAAGIGFAGVLLIIRPNGGLDPIGVAFGLLTACLFAGQFIATRRVAADNPFTTLVWSGLVGTICLTAVLPFSLPAALPALQAFTPLQWMILLSTGVFGALGHLLQIQAYRHSPASMLSPFLYLQIVAATTYGWLVWRQIPDAVTWAGICIVCLSGMGIAAHEWRQSRKR
ncbi:DMT family transporter [Paracandidimonas soli]|uniref:DMT family transporter n=1 Tax=Paracandidimonas soli TaxID=1917182 RepID=UPI0033414FD6